VTSALIIALAGEDASHSCCATDPAVWTVFCTLLRRPEQPEQYLVTPFLTHDGTASISMFATWERQKTMLEAKKRLNFYAEMSQLADNKCIMYIGTE